jgi:hypothetical protein
MKTQNTELSPLLAWAQKYNPSARIEGENVVVDGDFDCSNNQLTSLPESVGNMKIGGSFYCSNNQLTSLPESVGSMKIGGNFYCYGNQLTSAAPRVQKLKHGAFSDYTYLDGILTDVISVKTKNDLRIIKHSFGIVVSKGEFHAHGKDLRSATLDLHFKASSRDLGRYKSLNVNEQRHLEDLYEIYRNVTGACQFGTQKWLDANKDFVSRVEKSGASISEVAEKTKGEYGSEKLAEFFGLA